MKTLLKTALISAFSIIAAATHIQAATHVIQLSANVTGTCTISSTNATTGFNSATTFSANIDGSKAVQKLGTLTINHVCTSQAVALTLASANDGITGPTGGEAGTTNKINYTAKLFGNSHLLATLDTSVAGNTSATNSAKVAETPVSGSLTFEIAIIPTAGNLNLVASSAYADTLTITIDPGA
jgi:hypothetical protein